MAITVTIKGKNCFQPFLIISLNNDGFANLQPTISKIAAKTDNGILFKMVGIISIEINNKKPAPWGAMVVIIPRPFFRYYQQRAM